MKEKVVLFWFRRDLRLHDNCGLYYALISGLPVVPFFIFDRCILDGLQDKKDKRVHFIHDALEQMQDRLLQAGSTLDVRYGHPLSILHELLNIYNVTAVYTNHDYEPYARERDAEIDTILKQQGIAFKTFKDQVIFEKNEIVKADGNPYTIYTPYFKKWIATLNNTHYAGYKSETLEQHYFKQPPLPIPSLESMGFSKSCNIPPASLPPQTIIEQYHNTRNTPAVEGTSKMGVHLRFGTISIRQLLKSSLHLNETYVKELAWREFFMQMMWHNPRLVNESCKKDFEKIQWRNNEAEFERWYNGQTGCPIVDAGMRELAETGFMHNRVRMIVASFLIKDLLIDWKWGDAYFAQKLLDYELASNNGNWQWVAGCGCDAAPYFRIFNPYTQAKKFDPKELYIKRWVPEYGTDAYPKPVVDHAFAAQRCLAVYKKAVSKNTLLFNE